MEKKMENKNLEVFSNAPVPQAVLKNVLPAMAAMIMVLIYNLADTFFIGQTRNDILIAAVSLAMPVFLIFMAVGTVFGVGGTSVISRALGEGRKDYAKKVCSFCMWSCVIVGVVMTVLILVFMDQILMLVGASPDTMGPAKTYLTIVSLGGIFVIISNCYSNIIRAEGQAGKAMMGQGLQPLLGYCVGAGVWDRFKKVFRFSVLFALVIGVIMTLLCYLFTSPMVKVFLENPEAYDYGVRFARILLSLLLVEVLYVYTIRRMESKTKARAVESSQNA